MNMQGTFVSDLGIGDRLYLVGERMTVVEVHTHPKHGLEVRMARRCHPAPMWYSARQVQRWIDDAYAMDLHID